MNLPEIQIWLRKMFGYWGNNIGNQMRFWWNQDCLSFWYYSKNLFFVISVFPGSVPQFIPLSATLLFMGPVL
ncbi:hypothetical protein Patl1_07034 [Pistacia atlantica]|uniref:Uncharacterized protein n=1 Tax=Pistacia atlantica TaxID=434234 RepID=A0ACC1AHE0_9ROSI|nr:hypothetical protein Patl1_07034 [Pistacia atlantica]